MTHKDVEEFIGCCENRLFYCACGYFDHCDVMRYIVFATSYNMNDNPYGRSVSMYCMENTYERIKNQVFNNR